MKQLTATLLALLFCAHSFAQDGSEKPNYKKEKRESSNRPPVLYITPSTGINNNTGLVGVSLDVPVTQKVSIEGGAGLSTWGDKLYIGGKYFLQPGHRGWAFGVGLTYNTGISNYQPTLETIYNTNEVVQLDLHPQTNVFLAAYRYWKLGRRANRIYLELGWSVALSGNRFDQTAGDQISDNANNEMNLLAPGGLIVGCGFSFGVH